MERLHDCWLTAVKRGLPGCLKKYLTSVFCPCKDRTAVSAVSELRRAAGFSGTDMRTADTVPPCGLWHLSESTRCASIM